MFIFSIAIDVIFGVVDKSLAIRYRDDVCLADDVKK